MKFGKWFKSQQTPDLAGYYIPYTSVYPFIDRAPLEPPPVQLTKKINSVVDGERSEVSVLEELRGHIDVCSAKTAELLQDPTPSLRKLSVAWRFAHLNREAIRKITKKYDKLTGRLVSPQFAATVAGSGMAFETVWLLEIAWWCELCLCRCWTAA